VEIEQRRFRDALGAFATGVAVVTGRTETGEKLGMTVSSFNSVSLMPPLVLFSVARSAGSFATWTNMQRYAINILSQQQEELSNRFAKPSADRWSGLLVLDGRNGVPVLPNALAVFECEHFARHNGGDHEIFVGQVIAHRTHAHRLERPLIFFGGQYRRLDDGFHDLPPTEVSIFAGW
jgi:flavin reductase (DIM6/NTAB) family NADH-FMN oxidoreductase RutF